MNEVKIRILSTCPHCHGVAYFPFTEAVDTQGRTYMQYLPCTTCHGSGVTGKWITIAEFQKLLEQSACSHEHVSQVGGFHFSGGEVWDDIEEVCEDCDKVLD